MLGSRVGPSYQRLRISSTLIIIFTSRCFTSLFLISLPNNSCLSLPAHDFPCNGLRGSRSCSHESPSHASHGLQSLIHIQMSRASHCTDRHSRITSHRNGRRGGSRASGVDECRSASLSVNAPSFAHPPPEPESGSTSEASICVCSRTEKKNEPLNRKKDFCFLWMERQAAAFLLILAF